MYNARLAMLLALALHARVDILTPIANVFHAQQDVLNAQLMGAHNVSQLPNLLVMAPQQNALHTLHANSANNLMLKEIVLLEPSITVTMVMPHQELAMNALWDTSQMAKSAPHVQSVAINAPKTAPVILPAQLTITKDLASQSSPTLPPRLMPLATSAELDVLAVPKT